MKKHRITIMMLACVTFLMNAKSKDSGSYVFNMTGKPLILNFYAKPFGKETWIDSQTVGPLALAGKAPDDFLSTITTTLLPEIVDMHKSTSTYIRFEVLKLNSKLKDKNYHGVKINTPSLTSLFDYDYKVILDGDRIVVTRLNTVAGIPIPGKKLSDTDQWPSKTDMAILHMPPAERIVALQAQNAHLEDDVKKLKKEETKYHNKGAITQQKNRKRMKDEKKNKIKSNNETIARLQAQIDADKAADEAAAALDQSAPDAQAPTDTDVLNNQTILPGDQANQDFDATQDLEDAAVTSA